MQRSTLCTCWNLDRHANIAERRCMWMDSYKLFCLPELLPKRIVTLLCVCCSLTHKKSTLMIVLHCITLLHEVLQWWLRKMQIQMKIEQKMIDVIEQITKGPKWYPAERYRYASQNNGWYNALQCRGIKFYFLAWNTLKLLYPHVRESKILGNWIYHLC